MTSVDTIATTCPLPSSSPPEHLQARSHRLLSPWPLDSRQSRRSHRRIAEPTLTSQSGTLQAVQSPLRPDPTIDCLESAERPLFLYHGHTGRGAACTRARAWDRRAGRGRRAEPRGGEWGRVRRVREEFDSEANGFGNHDAGNVWLGQPGAGSCGRERD
jgi:hypothetical protein